MDYWLSAGGKGNIGVREWEVQTTGYKVGTRNIKTICCNKFKWKINFKIIQFKN